MFGIQNEDSLIKKCLKLLVFFSIVLTPIVFSVKNIYFFTTTKYVVLAFLGSICMVLLVLYFLDRKFILDKRIKVFLGISTALVLWLFVSSFFGADFTNSFWSNFGRHTGFPTYFFSFVLLLSSVFIFNKETLSASLKAFVMGGVLATLSIYLSPALLNVDLFFLKNSANGGTFGNTTYAAIFLVFSLFSAYILFVKEKVKSKKWAWIFCSFFILLNPIFLNTKGILTGNLSSIYSLLGEARAGIISVFLGLLASVILYFYFSNKKTYAIVAKVLLVMLFAVGVYFVASFLNEGSKLHQTFATQKEGVRFIYWDMAQIGIAERPIFGWGLENFPAVHNKYFDPVLLSPEYPSESWADKPHNVIFETTFSAGILGLLLYLSLIGYALISLIRKAFMSEGEDRIVASLFFGLLLSYIFQTSFAFDTVSSLQAFFVTLALVAVFCFKEVEDVGAQTFSKYVKTAVSIILVFLCITMIYFLSFKVGAESRMVREMNTISISKRTSVFQDTMNKSPAGTLVSESQYIDLLIEKYKKNWATLNLEVKQEALKELGFLLKYSTERSDAYPEDLRFALVSAKIANFLFDISGVKRPEILNLSKKYGVRAVNNSPGGEKGYRVLVETYLLEGKFDMAMKFAEMLVGLNGKVPEFHDLVIYIAKIKKDQKLIDEKTENAKKFIPNYEYGLGR